jgi:hypothetical protein
MQVGIHIMRVGGGDAIEASRQLVAEGSTQVKQDAFVNQGDDGFVASVERELTKLGGGKKPKNFLLVLAERLEDSFLLFSSGSVTKALDNILMDSDSNSYDETGRGYEESDSDYMPILVCILGYSESFKQWSWGSKQRHTAQPQNASCVFTGTQFNSLKQYIRNFHAESVTH